MKAIVVYEAGGTEQLIYTEVKTPRIKEGWTLVKVVGFAINHKESPGEYESYADIGLDEWIDMKIEVEGRSAKLYLNHAKQPVLIVNDLKHGEHNKGALGLWVDVGTEGFFKDLQITVY